MVALIPERTPRTMLGLPLPQEAMSDPMETNNENAGADLQNVTASSSSVRRTASIQASPDQEEVQATVEATDGDGQSSAAKKSLYNILKECIPEGSNPVLERMIHERDLHLDPRLRLIHDGNDLELLKPEDVWARIDRLKPSEHSILVIENIDDEWCEALCSRYPSSIDQTSLVEHILGIVRVTPRMQWSFHRQCDIGLADSVVADLERIDQAILL